MLFSLDAGTVELVPPVPDASDWVPSIEAEANGPPRAPESPPRPSRAPPF